MNTEQNRKHVDMTVYCCCVRYRVSPALDYQPTYNADFMHWYHNMMGSLLSNPLMRCDICVTRESGILSYGTRKVDSIAGYN